MVKMNIRKIKMEDANSYLEMLLNLDKETKFMMFEPEERSKSIDIARRKIENTIKDDNLILVASEGTEIIGFLSVERGYLEELDILAMLLLAYEKSIEAWELAVNYFQNLINGLEKII